MCQMYSNARIGKRGLSRANKAGGFSSLLEPPAAALALEEELRETGKDHRLAVELSMCSISMRQEFLEIEAPEWETMMWMALFASCTTAHPGTP